MSALNQPLYHRLPSFSHLLSQSVCCVPRSPPAGHSTSLPSRHARLVRRRAASSSFSSRIPLRSSLLSSACGYLLIRFSTRRFVLRSLSRSSVVTPRRFAAVAPLRSSDKSSWPRNWRGKAKILPLSPARRGCTRRRMEVIQICTRHGRQTPNESGIARGRANCNIP